MHSRLAPPLRPGGGIRGPPIPSIKVVDFCFYLAPKVCVVDSALLDPSLKMLCITCNNWGYFYISVPKHEAVVFMLLLFYVLPHAVILLNTVKICHSNWFNKIQTGQWPGIKHRWVNQTKDDGKEKGDIGRCSPDAERSRSSCHIE